MLLNSLSSHFLYVAILFDHIVKLIIILIVPSISHSINLFSHHQCNNNFTCMPFKSVQQNNEVAKIKAASAKAASLGTTEVTVEVETKGAMGVGLKAG